MSLSDLTEHMNTLGSAWEQYKSINDRRLAELERKGSADPLYYEHLSRLSDAMDNTKSRMDRFETVLSRPALPEAGEAKAYDPTDGAYRKAFVNYLRKGMDAGLEVLATKALLVGSDPEGGYMVTPTMSSKIVSAIFETSPIRPIASVETISSDALEMLDDHVSASAGWTAETAPISDSATPTIAKRNIPVHEIYAQPTATQKLVDDSAIDIESWIAFKVADIIGRMENAAFVNGTGVGQPRGFLTYANGTSWGQIQQFGTSSSGEVTSDSLVNLYYGLKDAYMKRATFLMNRMVIAQVRTLKSTTNQYIWQPSLTAGSPDTLLGVPVMMAADMPVPTAGSLSVAVGDFSQGYQIVDRQGITILRDPFTNKPFVRFYTTKRTGGDVVNFDAIKLLSLA